MSRPKIYSDEEYLHRKRELSRAWHRKNPYRPKDHRSRSGDKAYVSSPNPGMSSVDDPRRVMVPQHLLEDRDRRKAHVPTIIGSIMGDPGPGQSALDQKRNAGELR